MAGPYAYVANATSASISKIDLSTFSVVSTLSVGLSYYTPYSIGINQTATMGYYSEAVSGYFCELDLSSFTTGRSVLLVAGIRPLIIDPTGTYAYCCQYINNLSKNYKVVLSTMTTPLYSSGPYKIAGLAMDPAGAFMYSSGSSSGLGQYVLPSGAEAGYNSYSGNAGIAVDPTGTYVYWIANGGSLYKCDNTSGAAIVGSALSGSFSQIAIDPSGNFAYLTTDGPTGTVTKVDLATFTVVGSALTTSTTGSLGITIDSLGNYAYVTNPSDNTVVKIDLATFALVGSPLTVGTSPQQIALEPYPTYAPTGNRRSFTPIARAAFR